MCKASSRIVVYAIACFVAPAAGFNTSAAATQYGSDPTPVRRVLDDYIGLYRQETLGRWKALFLPGFTATFTSDDGSVLTRTLDEFYERQRGAFERAAVSERLENVRIERLGRLAHVSADFYFTSGETTRHGQLMLLMMEEKGRFRVAALTFTYDLR